MSATAIRPIAPADRDAWLPLWRGYQRFYRVDLSEETSAVAFARLLDPAEPMAGMLAWRGEEPVGLVHLVQHRSFWTIGDYCYLQDLFVAEAARGLGIGRQLIEHTYDWARARGCSRVHWLTHETNAEAMALYDRLAARSGFLQYRKLFVPL